MYIIINICVDLFVIFSKIKYKIRNSKYDIIQKFFLVNEFEEKINVFYGLQRKPIKNKVFKEILVCLKMLCKINIA